MRLKEPILVLIIVAFMWWFYHPVLTTFFSQDDFFHFNLALKNPGFESVVKILPFSQRGVAFYRPLSREMLYGSYYQLFGLEVVPFRLLALGLQTLNLLLVWRLFRRWFNPMVGVVAALYYGLSASNVAVLYYLAGGIQAQLAVFWSLLSLGAMEHFWAVGRWRWWVLSFGCWGLAMMSHELAIVLLVIILARWWSTHRQLSQLKMLAYQLGPFVIVSLILIWVEVHLIGYDTKSQQYAISISLKSLSNTLGWYLVWSIGLPEMLIDFVRSGLGVNPNLMKYWGEYYRLIFPSFGVVMLGLAGMFGYLVIIRDAVINSRRFLALIIWWPAALLPILFLPEHKSTYYLAFANVGMAGVVGVIAWRFWQRLNLIKGFVGIGVVISFMILAMVSSSLGSRYYWAAGRGRLAESILDLVVTKYPQVQPGTVIYLTNDPNYPQIGGDWGGTSKQAALAINNGDALRLYYHDQNLQVYFEDLGGLPAGVDPAKVKSLMVASRRFR